jgi:thymidine phosphorylase
VLDFTEPGVGRSKAEELLNSGKAWHKFEAICAAQGGLHEPPIAPHRFDFVAARSGIVEEIDNRKLSRLAKLAGAPRDACAGIVLHARLGVRVSLGEPLLTLHAESAGELDYAMAYLEQHTELLRIGEGA